MTGVEEHNFPAFMEAAAIWRAAGHDVLNPAELDGPEPDHEALAKVPASWFYRRDLAAEVSRVELILTLDEYQERALATAAMDLDQVAHRATMGLGIAGEAGEVADLVKKEIGHGHAPDPAAIAREDGDVLWYVAMVAHAYGHTLGDVARANIQKLAHRYPTGFTTEGSVNRVDEPAWSR
jgi:NTP pyrophosphatase (non-canonical NTP hydrolase)